MRFQGALIREQGVDFALVVVKQQVLGNHAEANNVIRGFRPVFPGMPVVLMAQDHAGVATYYGRRDIVQFMSTVPLEAVPWKEYTVN